MAKSNVNFVVQIRPAELRDKEFIVSLLPRLVEFGPPPWRDIQQMTTADTQIITDKLDNRPPGTAIFIAEDDKGVALGFIHLQEGSDFYNREKHGHISDIIVTPEAEGRGIGRALIEEGEEWAQTQGFRWLTLSVFAQNIRARETYERLGFGADFMKYVKELR